MSLCKDAIHLARRQFRVFPLCGIDARGYGVCYRSPCTDSPGKHPMIKDWQREATWRLDKIRWWWEQWPYANIGIATGRGFFVLDVDPGHGGEDSLEDLESIHGRLPDTFLVQTGGGGWHYYYRSNESIKNGCNTLGPGIDIRGDGGYVVGPGSIHISGRKYIVEAFSPFSLAIAPAWLLEEMAKNGRSQNSTKYPEELPRVVREGGRNDFLFGEALYHKIRSMSFERTLMYCGAVNDEICRPPLPRTEVLAIVNSVYSDRRKR